MFLAIFLIVILGGETESVAWLRLTCWRDSICFTVVIDVCVPDAQFDDPNYYSFKTVAPGIKIHDLWDYIHEKRDSIFFDAEFKKLRSGLIHKHEIASSEENKGKNRYRKMYACATEKTLEDLWRMIWQQKVDKIVMLTNLVEMGTGRDTRVVKQFHFKAWPDKDVPDTAWCLVDFWRAVGTRDEQQSPILVHCSAGVGRTGTFIALDNLISQAKMEKCVRPFQMVEALREQRVSMVQTKEQYVYLHEALAEALLIGTHHVTTGQFERVYNYMMGRNDDSTDTRLEHQFELVRQSVEHDPVEIQEVSSQEAEYGNIETVGTELHPYRHPPNRKRDQPIELNIPKYVLKDGTDGEHIENGALSVIKESLHNGFVEITYSVKKNANESGFDKTIKHFVLTSWKGDDTHTERTSLLKMIEAVHTWQLEMKEDKPILILDNACFQKCGVVAVLINEIYRISAQHGHINILESVKTMVQGKSLLIHSKASRRHNITIIKVNAPTVDNDDEDIEQFYDELERIIVKVPKIDILVVQDCDAVIGRRSSWERERRKNKPWVTTEIMDRCANREIKDEKYTSLKSRADN
ncbi:receptor-type tyrosine-protein phosphatase kappa-like [Dreissena polymorpha]|uniref:receptor-type tyrosine-protein phosphatase kappa-like n=1 Tax=Dreissena polymorpha TaxID=45954 RepID=UPI0022650E18|nr:receptor-type tyrosine-protein phosphatase kappa-like [Dreissena polymorpha]